MNIKIKDSVLKVAARNGVDAFLDAVLSAFKSQVGEELNAESMQYLSADQITLWGYLILRDELMDGGFVQLIYNGYGPFYFDNPFAKAMRLWDCASFQNCCIRQRKPMMLTKKN